MTNQIMQISIDLQFASSLKQRRKYTNAIKDLLKNRNISVLDLSGEYPKEARLACSFLSLGSSQAHQKSQHIEELLFSKFPELVFEFEYDED